MVHGRPNSLVGIGANRQTAIWIAIRKPETPTCNPLHMHVETTAFRHMYADPPPVQIGRVHPANEIRHRASSASGCVGPASEWQTTPRVTHVSMLLYCVLYDIHIDLFTL